MGRKEFVRTTACAPTCTARSKVNPLSAICLASMWNQDNQKRTPTKAWPTGLSGTPICGCLRSFTCDDAMCTFAVDGRLGECAAAPHHFHRAQYHGNVVCTRARRPRGGCHKLLPLPCGDGKDCQDRDICAAEYR